MKVVTLARGVQVGGAELPRSEEVLTPEALEFVAQLHRRFESRRQELLDARTRRQAQLDGGKLPDFLPETQGIREGSWTVGTHPKDLQDRRVEITGPTERKMMINALNSGARVFMADFEDSLSPTWANVVGGQVNLLDAVRRTLAFTSAEGKAYRLGKALSTLLVRPRGWHLVERHVLVDGKPVSASLFDFGLYFFHNAKELLARGTGPYYYLPKMESHLEARLWNDVFNHAEDALKAGRGKIKATVLIETILAAFEMEEILFELRDHASGLNAGRWDYIFSVIKKFRNRPDFILPDRAQVTMSVPFMRAYTQLLIRTCHRRGAFAMGGMAAFVPNRRDAKATETALAKVREDKEREARDGCDGTWVAHPDLVPVAMEVFDSFLGKKPNQLERRRDDVHVAAHDLLGVKIPGGAITEAGLRNNVSVGLLYLESWLRGQGAAAIYNLMEDTATAEIARSQVWQWIRHRSQLKEGALVSPELVRRLLAEELEQIRGLVGDEAYDAGRFEDARHVFETVALGSDYVEFLTHPAYERIA